MRRYFRAYPAISSRQQGADRLVYSEDDLRRVLWQAVDPTFEGERPSTIRLAADIYLSRPIELGAYQYNVSIEGSGRFAIAEGGTFTGSYLFGLPDGSISDIDFVNVTFSTTNVALLFNGSSLTTVDDFIFEECSLELGVFLSMFQKDIVVTSTRIDIDDYPPSHSFGVQDPSGVGDFTGVLSIGPYLTQYESKVPIIARTDDGVGFKEENPSVAVDINGGLRIQPVEITLSGADPVIDTTDRSFFDITIDNATATGTMTMTAGQAGQVVVLYFQNTATHMVVDDTLTMNVGKTYHAKKPTQDETISFIYINGKWQELCRSENT
jgi:hypothetical protein